MNNNIIKYKQWAIKIPNETFSKAIQKLAFSYEFAWSYMNEKIVQYQDQPWIVINPNNNTISFRKKSDLEHLEMTVATSIEEVISLFEEPPTNVLGLFGGDVILTKDGEVNIVGKHINGFSI
jgi:hypothetical protein